MDLALNNKDFWTANICDRGQDDVRVVDLAMRSFGGIPAAAGAVELVRLHDDNRLLFDVVAKPGGGRILMVAVEADSRPAVVGENVARAAFASGWGGIIVDGAVRDARVLPTIPILIVARETRPFRLKTDKRGDVVAQLAFGGVVVRAGDQAAVDQDGIVFFRATSP